MRFVRTLVALELSILVAGCGGGAIFYISTGQFGPPPNIVIIVGNWEFVTTPNAMGKLPETLAGSLSQSGTSVSGVVHLAGSSCFDQMAAVAVTGSVNGSSSSLTSAPVNGQVVKLTGSFNKSVFNGTYVIKGGCANGETGKVAGANIPAIANQMSGTFTDTAQKTFSATGDIAQSGNANPDGSFGIEGTATFDTACFKKGILRAGTASSGSFIMGKTVALEFDTDNGTLIFAGRLSDDGRTISGNYTVAGGTCTESGSAVLSVTSP
jgi:hypothetical protein